MDHTTGHGKQQKRTFTPVIVTITINMDKCCSTHIIISSSSITTNKWSMTTEDHGTDTRTPPAAALRTKNPVVALIRQWAPFNATADLRLVKRTSVRPRIAELNTSEFASDLRRPQSIRWLETGTMANWEEEEEEERVEEDLLERPTLLLLFRCQWQALPNDQWSSSSTTSPRQARVSHRGSSTRRHLHPPRRRLPLIPVETTTLTIQRCSCSSREPFPRSTGAWTVTRPSRIAGTTRTSTDPRVTRVRSVDRSLRGGITWRHTARLNTRTCALLRPVAHPLRWVSITAIRVISRTLLKCDKMGDLRRRTKRNWERRRKWIFILFVI